ncbi:Phenylalanine--tRNA ligase beta subunit [Neolecta irregularis DAH-3]|uniref:phenylalanine--tRNA ligase n=1 Tax=Neolecta irregularis (strain DAH-3) TaxID=1198029 RepID=A0A1U7LPV9_NEOID|nr:Phenylalanine--tRNA ligase beta subunit [Neolecta irregularis DAH-3]|eukprot:OLL24582.1 Phenylalanine--tRNA ligase beta subunit [Neolecta irregularis DAH-3]
MSLQAKPYGSDMLEVQIPLTRADILHQCDVMEDVAIAYGYNKLNRTFPDKSATVGQPLPINKLSDIVRLEAALVGWTEVMPLILCSHAENFDNLKRKDHGQAVKLANPKTWEYQVVRTSLLPGMLKTIRENKERVKPLKVFEVSDVVLQDENVERRARNVRRFGAVWCGKTSGFEHIHGLLDRVMAMLGEKFLSKDCSDYGYWIEPVSNDTYFPGRAATVHLRNENGAMQIGNFGILHPEVLEKFELTYPCSSLEMDLEYFL